MASGPVMGVRVSSNAVSVETFNTPAFPAKTTALLTKPVETGAPHVGYAVQKERGPRQKKHDITEVGLKFGKNKLEKAANAEEGPKTKDSNSVGVDLPLTEAKIDFNTVNTVSPLLAMGWPLGGGNMAGFALDATLIAALTNASKSSVIVFQSAEVKSIILNKLWPLIFTLHVAQTPNIYAAIAFDALDSGIRKTITTHLNTDGELVPDVEEVRLLICLLFCLHGNGQTPELAYAASLSDTYRFWLARHCANFYATEESRFGRLIDFVEAVSAIDLDGLQLLRLNFKLDPATIIACFTAGAEVNKI
uniref:NR LBD domain-containing protein n=1 Tax=Panagrellus redivivus TaxID=6233 RepID=A0A7E4W1D5_PANRE